MEQFTTIHESFDSDRKCPYCNKEADDATGRERPPVSGDVSVCLYCAETMIFKGQGRKLKLEKLEGEELEKVLNENPGLREELEDARKFVQGFKEYQKTLKK